MRLSAHDTAAIVLAQAPSAPDPGGQGEDFGKSSPVGLVLLILFFIAVAFLIRSMSKHLRKLPTNFSEERAAAAAPARAKRAEQAAAKDAEDTVDSGDAGDSGSTADSEDNAAEKSGDSGDDSGTDDTSDPESDDSSGKTDEQPAEHGAGGSTQAH